MNKQNASVIIENRANSRNNFALIKLEDESMLSIRSLGKVKAQKKSEEKIQIHFTEYPIQVNN